ncbi:Nicotinamide phosphoribosyltransferase [Fasciolopsis buskii]|uniref:Nicotinamide phosphoribosyltransferase n=1 Tax=Fasciolopsis buskii TaxID=27845 RepID=A0A8E0S9D7_9TREM|nr:Nicotinamide phosphoribosyltransferase [Fasciolopsis buski]
MTMWGEKHEVDAYHRLLDLYKDGTFSCVSDSYNVWEACEHIWGEQLRDKVINRNGTLVVRPDSGEPTTVVAKVLDILGSKFHYTVNDKGYRVLPSCIRVIQGDGISSESIGKLSGCPIKKTCLQSDG